MRQHFFEDLGEGVSVIRKLNAFAGVSALLVAAVTGACAQNISVTPKLIQFPNQGVGTTSQAYTVTVNNNQSASLTIKSIEASAPFAQTNNCGSGLASNQTCTISVTFNPTAKQYYSSSLVITDDAGNSPQSVQLTGNGVIPVSYAPAELRFPDQGIHSTSAPMSFTLTNNQSQTLSISGVQAGGAFAQTNNCTSLGQGQSCTVNVTFTPTSAQYYSGSIVVNDSASTSPQQIPVNGNGVLAIKYTPPQGGYYFNHQIVNTSSTPQPVTLTNNQSSPVSITGITAPTGFTFTNGCGSSIAGGASCTVEVSFDPPAATTYSGNLQINDSAYGSPILIPLQGMGIPGTPNPYVSVTPQTPCITGGQSIQFSAIVNGESNQAVDWYVNGVKNGSSSVGTISSSGLYTAPSSGSHTIRAVSQASSSVSGSTTVAIEGGSAMSYEMYPYVASIPVGGQQTFRAETCGAIDTNNISYFVDGVEGGNSSVGTINSSGVYTAPNASGRHQIRVTDNTLNRSTAGQVTVFSNVTADFASRAKNTTPVPASMFGYGRGESIPTTSARNLLTQGGLTDSRLSAEIINVYASQSPDWTKIDPFIQAIQASGQKALLQLNQTPTWLQPSSGACAGNMYAEPTDLNQWAQIAAAYVAHMDANFPGVVQDYEIWNEPNAATLCANDHLSAYLAIYAAAAPVMKAQASQDKQTIRIGGPVLSGYDPSWVTGLLTNSSTAPYVDFVSYHHYLYGSSQLDAQWDTNNGFRSVYEMTQDPSVGAFGDYQRFARLVAAGNQPGGANTPIYVTEYNVNWAFFQDCCRNDPTYAPVWNALYVTDMLNAPYNGVPLPPAKLFYFAGSAYPYFCLVGVQDSNNDCLYSAGATPAPYPQYYAYQLIGSPQYLGLGNGGYMAKSISTPTGGGGLATTAFYTSSKDAILIVNPTSTAFSQVPVTFANPGFTSTEGTLYQIQNGSEITTSSVALTSSGTSRTATIDVPAYSVQAISIQ